MWGMVIVLVGGIYWIYKYIDEKSNEEAFQRHENQAEKINEKLKATQDEELYVKSLLKNEDTRWKALESISADLTEIYGLGWKKYFQDDSDFEGDYSMIYSQWGKAYHLLLSKQGKIPKMFSDTYPLAGGGEKTNQTIRTCKNIEKNIQMYHPEVRIMFVPGSYFSITTHENEYYEDVCMGKLYWEHNIPLKNKKWNPNIRKLW